jgi:hypothetical protein
MKRFALAALVASAPASAHPIRIELPQHHDAEETAEGTAQLATAIRTRDARAVAKLLQTPLDHGALWFPDAACTKRFGKIGLVDAKELDAFARCLATLELITTTRTSALPVMNTVLTYKPGIEIELGFSRGKLFAVGDHALAVGAVPMLTAQAFEALRKTGSTSVDTIVAAKLDPEVAKTGPASAWLRVCLDPKAGARPDTAVGVAAIDGGRATITIIHSSSPLAGETFQAAALDWTFRPFEHRGTAIPACSLSLVTYPAAKAPAVETLPPMVISFHPTPPEDPDPPYNLDFEGITIQSAPAPQNIPPTALESLRIAGTRSIIPEPATTAEIVKAGKPRIIGSFKLCVGTTGFVTSVTTLKSTGYPAYDLKLGREMRTWKFRPYLVNRQPVPVCTAETFIYKP